MGWCGPISSNSHLIKWDAVSLGPKPCQQPGLLLGQRQGRAFCPVLRALIQTDSCPFTPGSAVTPPTHPWPPTWLHVETQS